MGSQTDLWAWTTQAGGALESLTKRLGYRAVDALAYHVSRLCRSDVHGNGVFDAARALATLVAAQSPSAMATSLDPLQKWLRRLMHALLELVDVGSVHGQEQVRLAVSVPTSLEFRRLDVLSSNAELGNIFQMRLS
jgi:hypothetical protein